MISKDLIRAALGATMPDGCKVIDYLEDAVPNESSLKELGIDTAGYGISDIRSDIHQDFYCLIIGAIMEGATRSEPSVSTPDNAILERAVYDKIFEFDTVGTFSDLSVAVELRQRYASEIVNLVMKAATPRPSEAGTFVTVGHSFCGMPFGALAWDREPTDLEVRDAYEAAYPHSRANLNYETHSIRAAPPTPAGI